MVGRPYICGATTVTVRPTTCGCDQVRREEGGKQNWELENANILHRTYYIAAAMSVSYWALGMAMAIVTGVCSALLWRMWILRHSFSMEARAPNLTVFAGLYSMVMTLSMLLHWTLLLEGRGLPCYAMVWLSYSCESRGRHRVYRCRGGLDEM